jgi:hypothetical protein
MLTTGLGVQWTSLSGAFFAGAVILYLATVAPAKALGSESHTAALGTTAFYEHPVREARTCASHQRHRSHFLPFCALQFFSQSSEALRSSAVDGLAIAS